MLFLYFSFFLILLKYFLPTFSKLFKIRSYFLRDQKNLNNFLSIKFNDSNQILNLLSKFEEQIKINLIQIQVYLNSKLQNYNLNYLKNLNKMFLFLYVKLCLSTNLYKKLYN